MRIEPNIQRHLDNVASMLNVNLDSLQTRLSAEIGAISQRADTMGTQQEQLQTSVSGLQHSLDAGQATIIEHLSTLTSAVSRLRLHDSHLHSETVIKASDEDLIARIFRAELHQIVTPAFKHYFDQYKADSDGKLDSLRKGIDAMAQQLGKGLHISVPKKAERTMQHLNEESDNSMSGKSAELPWPTDPSVLKLPDSQTTMCQSVRTSKTRIKSQTRIYRWAIGTLWVSCSSFRIERVEQREDLFDQAPSAQKSYKVTIGFQPSQSLMEMRGIMISIKRFQDQRGHYQLCPSLSTFAVIPESSEVFQSAVRNDVAGLRCLFAQRLAAPSDRDEGGFTPLMVRIARRGPPSL